MPKAATKRHANFLVRTLGPDLRESGYVETAKDVIRCGRLMARGAKSPKFAHFLTSTLVPDLRRGGMVDTANDLGRCARAIKPRPGQRRWKRR